PDRGGARVPLAATEVGGRDVKRVDRAEPPPVHGLLPTDRVRLVVELAFQICAEAGANLVSTGHILIALAAEGGGIAAKVLKDAAATPENIARALPAEPET